MEGDGVWGDGWFESPGPPHALGTTDHTRQKGYFVLALYTGTAFDVSPVLTNKVKAEAAQHGTEVPHKSRLRNGSLVRPVCRRTAERYRRRYKRTVKQRGKLFLN